MAGRGAAARAACAALLDAALRLGASPLPGTVIVGFTTRERATLETASSLARGGAPERAEDHALPRTKAAVETVLLGGAGPAELVGKRAVRSASAGGYALGEAAAPGAGTALGAASARAWSLPARYAGSEVETVSLADVEALARELASFLRGQADGAQRRRGR